MAAAVALVLLVATSGAARGHGRVDTVSKVVLGVQGYLRSHCVYLTATGDKTADAMLLDVQRRLSASSIQSAVLGVSAASPGHRLLLACNSPVFAYVEENDSRRRLASLSDAKGFSGRNWLLFLNDSSNLDEYFQDVDIPFDCELIVAGPLVSDGSLRLTEVYRVARHLPLVKHDFGSWSLRKGFTWPIQSFHDRRNDLAGIVFKTSIHKWAPLAYIRGAGPGERVQVEGFFGVIWRILEHKLNFSSELSVPDDGMWGSLLENGSWDGLMGAVLRHEADMVGVGLTMTPERADAVTFLLPLFVNYLRIYIRQPRQVVSLWGLTSPFSSELWLALLASAVVMTAILALLSASKDRQTVNLVFQVFCAMFCQQGMTIRPRTASKRIVVFLVYLLGTVIITSYSCFVISSLTAYKPAMPFHSLGTFLKDGTYSLGMVKIGHVYEEFKNAQEHKQKVLKEAFDKHVDTDYRNTPLTDEEGFQRVCTHRYAFITEEGAVLLSTDLNCVVVGLKTHFAKTSVSYIFPKDNPYVGLFNHNLLILMNSGILRKLYKESYNKRPVVPKAAVRASFDSVVPILSVGLVGIVVSLLVLLYEIVTYNTCSNKEDQNMSILSAHEKSICLGKKSKCLRRKNRSGI